MRKGRHGVYEKSQAWGPETHGPEEEAEGPGAEDLVKGAEKEIPRSKETRRAQPLGHESGGSGMVAREVGRKSGAGGARPGASQGTGGA